MRAVGIRMMIGEVRGDDELPPPVFDVVVATNPDHFELAAWATAKLWFVHHVEAVVAETGFERAKNALRHAIFWSACRIRPRVRTVIGVDPLAPCRDARFSEAHGCRSFCPKEVAVAWQGRVRDQPQVTIQPTSARQGGEVKFRLPP